MIQSFYWNKPQTTQICCGSATRRVTLHDISAVPQPYTPIWKWQKKIVEDVWSERSLQKLLVVQHQPVYTLGAGSTLDNVAVDLDSLPYPFFRTERGGEITYHGPGQLVLYPILNLNYFQKDLHWFLRCLEEVVLKALWEVSGLRGEKIPDLTGVWVNGEKVAAIGIRAKKWITYHGVALNVSMDLEPYQYIIPCGIAHKSVTTVEKIHTPNKQWTGVVEELIMEYRVALTEAFSEIFEIEIQHSIDDGVAEGTDGLLML